MGPVTIFLLRFLNGWSRSHQPENHDAATERQCEAFLFGGDLRRQIQWNDLLEKASSWPSDQGNKEYVSRQECIEQSQHDVKCLGKGKVILLLVAILLVGGITTFYLSQGPSGPTNSTGPSGPVGPSTGPTGPTTGPTGSGGHAYYVTLYIGFGTNETV